MNENHVFTEAEVVAFFKAKLVEFQAKLPGYASIQLDYSRHASGEETAQWKVYHNDNGHSPGNDKETLEAQIKWHFSTDVLVKKIETLRSEAAEKLRMADELEHAYR